MSNINKRIKVEFSSIKPNEKTKKQIYDNIINQQAHKNIHLNPIFISCLLVFTVGMISLVYADEIKETINNIKFKYVDNDSKEETRIFKHKVTYDVEANINYDANISNDEVYSYKELETLLGIKLLRSEEFEVYPLKSSITRKDNKIATATFSLPKRFVNYEEIRNKEEGIKVLTISNISINLKTKYADNDEEYLFHFGNEPKKEEYYLSKLDIPVNIIKNNKNRKLIFEYNHVVYTYDFIFGGYGYTEEAINSWIEGFLNSLN